MALKIDSADVIKVVLQFLKENSLSKAYLALEEETQISLNSVESIETLTSEIVNGRWDTVLRNVSNLRLPVMKLAALYEHITLELIEVKELETARAVLRTDPLFSWLRQNDPSRYLRLERILSAANGAQRFDGFEAYGAKGKEHLRISLAQSITSEVIEAPPSRLLSLVGQAIKWQHHQGLLAPAQPYDLFLDTQTKEAKDQILRHQQQLKSPIKILESQIIFGSKSHANISRFPPDGKCLVTGSSDGFVEIYDFTTGRLRLDLDFQAKDEFMMHDDAILSLSFSSDSDLLASGSQDGKIKVWQLYTGKCLRRFESAHSKGVTSLCFSPDNTQILSSSFDQTLRLHGLRSGKTLKTFRGHTSFVNHCSYTQEGKKIISVSSDGSIKVWDPKTSECLHSLKPIFDLSLPSSGGAGSSGGGGFDISILTFCFVPHQAELIVVCPRASSAFLMNYSSGQIMRKYSSLPKIGSSAPPPTPSRPGKFQPNFDEGPRQITSKSSLSGMCFVSCEVSPNADFLYCLGDDCKLYTFEFDTAELLGTLEVHEKEPIGLSHHPFLPLLATYADGPLRLWKP